MANPTDQSGNLLGTDGGFEYGIANNSMDNTTFKVPTGWRADNGTPFEVWGNGFNGQSTKYGTNFIELDNGDGVDSYSHQVNTLAGQSYTLSLSSMLRAGAWSATSGVEVLWNGKVVGTFAPTDATKWADFAFNVVGTGGADTLTIREASWQSDGIGALIDNVALVANPTANLLGKDGSFEFGVANNTIDGTTLKMGSAWASDNGSVFKIIGNGYHGQSTQVGTNFLELDNGSGVDSYSHQVSTIAGQNYTLSLSSMLRAGASASTSGVEVLWNGKLVGTFAPTDATKWTDFTFQVTGTGADKLTIREVAGQSDGVGALIDNVSITVAQRPNLLGDDGGFEFGIANNAMDNTAFKLPSGWTADNGTPFEIWGNGFNGQSTKYGSNFLELDNGLGVDSYSHLVNTVYGRSYTLSLSSMLRAGAGTETSGVEVLWNGKVVGTFAPTDATKWTDFAFNVVGTGGADKLTIREVASQSDGLGALIDNVALVVAAPVVTSAAQVGGVTEDLISKATGQVSARAADNGAFLKFAGTAAGTYGTFAVDQTTGQWTYTLDNSKANVQALAEGGAAVRGAAMVGVT